MIAVNKRTLVTVLVIVVLLAIPVTLALASGQLFAPDEETYHVLAVSRVSTANDPYTMQILNGVYQAKREGKLIDLDLITLRDDNTPDLKSYDYKEEYDLVVVSLENMDEILPDICQTYPQVLFLTVDSTIPADKLPQNMINIVFRSHEAGYTAGYAAGAMTKSGKVGILLGVEDSPLLENYASAFEAGLALGGAEQDKKVTPVRRYAGSYYDFAAGYSCAEELYNEGCDIVFTIAGASGTGGIRAAAVEDKYVIGADQDENDLAPANVIFLW
jgi:Uncharacterized ABC-type transport system, periplasmic component/surface lipoprotein